MSNNGSWYWTSAYLLTTAAFALGVVGSNLVAISYAYEVSSCATRTALITWAGIWTAASIFASAVGIWTSLRSIDNMYKTSHSTISQFSSLVALSLASVAAALLAQDSCGNEHFDIPIFVSLGLAIATATMTFVFLGSHYLRADNGANKDTNNKKNRQYTENGWVTFLLLVLLLLGVAITIIAIVHVGHLPALDPRRATGYALGSGIWQIIVPYYVIFTRRVSSDNAKTYYSRAAWPLVFTTVATSLIAGIFNAVWFGHQTPAEHELLANAILSFVYTALALLWLIAVGYVSLANMNLLKGVSNAQMPFANAGHPAAAAMSQMQTSAGIHQMLNQQAFRRRK